MDTRSEPRLRAHRRPPWPRNRQRERVLGLVRDHDGAIDAAELADRIGLHVTTVRFHLDALCAQGVITRVRIKQARVGRPRTGYLVVRDRLDYRSLAEVLALELGDTVAQRRERAERAGQRWAGRIVADQSAEASEPLDSPGSTEPRDPDRIVDRQAAIITEIFDRMGFAPELASAAESQDARRERTIRLYECPVRDLARSHPEIGCGMHMGLLRGLLGAGAVADGGATLHAELDPFVEPELCIVRIIDD